MMLIAASWPSNRLAAVTNRTGCAGRCNRAAGRTRPRCVVFGVVGFEVDIRHALKNTWRSKYSSTDLRGSYSGAS